MKKLSFLALLVIVLIPLRSQAQRNPIEIGFDASLIRSVIETNVPGNAGRTSLAIPAPSVRFGIFLSDLVSLETDVSHQYTSSEDQTNHNFSLGTGVQYHITPPTRSSTFFMGVGTRVNSRGQATGNAKREFEDEWDKDRDQDRAILGLLGMTRKMSGTKMTGTLNADLRMTLNLGSPERLGIK